MFSSLPSVNLPVVVLKFYKDNTGKKDPITLSLYLGKVLFRHKSFGETFIFDFLSEEMFAIETNIFPSLGHIL